jgi:hypothetical protein
VKISVFDAMNIDKSIEAMNDIPKKRLGTVGFPDAHAEIRKSIDPQTDRSNETKVYIFSANPMNSPRTRIDQDTKGCRDCPEGMEW